MPPLAAPLTPITIAGPVAPVKPRTLIPLSATRDTDWSELAPDVALSIELLTTASDSMEATVLFSVKTKFTAPAKENPAAMAPATVMGFTSAAEVARKMTPRIDSV